MAAVVEEAMEEANNDAAAAAALSELTALLSPSSPAAPAAAEAALALSGSASGRALLASSPAALSALSAMAASASRGAQPALSALVNASSERAALEPLLAVLPSFLPLLPSSGAACGVVANLCREVEAVPRVAAALGAGAEPLLRALSAERPPEELGALLCNLGRAREGRAALLEPSGRVLRALLALVQWPHSAQLRRGVVGAIRNCCFQHEHHEWLLGPELEALPALLLPLAGNEELEETEMEKLPVDLQFLPPEHQREEEPEIRKMLLETLLLVLIGDEPEAGMENLLEVTIPQELEQQLEQLDREEGTGTGTGTGTGR